MRSIIASSFNQTDEIVREYLQQLLDSHNLYKTKHKIVVLTVKEIEFIEFLLVSFRNSGQMPSEDLFVTNFPEVSGSFNGIPVMPIDDFRVYVGNLISKRVNKNISKEILAVQQEIEQKGISDELMQRLNTLHKLSNMNKTKDIDLDIDFQTYYEEKRQKPIGMIFGIPELDEKIGGLNEGTVTTIAGFTSHFKSTVAINCAYYNVVNNGYNIVLFSLETPKEDVYMNVLCRHSYDSKFVKYPFISHDRIRKCLLSDEEIDYLYNVVDPDFKSSPGKLIILDETDFNTMSFGEIYALMEEIDDKLGGNLDAFIVDYVQLFKFGDSTTTSTDDNKAVNAFVSFFRRLTQSFRDGKHNKKLIGILLSQINRTAWKKADRNGGKYDLTCLADANELERGSHRVLTTFTTPDMKMAKEITMQILKNRNGECVWEPQTIFADPEAYVVGDASAQGFGGSFSSPSTAIGGAGLGDLFNDDLGGLI